MKRIKSLFIILTIILLLTGCGTKKKDTHSVTSTFEYVVGNEPKKRVSASFNYEYENMTFKVTNQKDLLITDTENRNFAFAECSDFKAQIESGLYLEKENFETIKEGLIKDKNSTYKEFMYNGIPGLGFIDNGRLMIQFKVNSLDYAYLKVTLVSDTYSDNLNDLYKNENFVDLFDGLVIDVQ